MKLSDYVFSFLCEHGIDTVFYLPGGGCMHLLDSLGRCCGNAEMKAVSMLHEQAVAIAAESYANTAEKPGCALVTTGPGTTNTITGCLAAYLDSTPVLFISGQCKTTDLKSRYGVRSLGSQEADIVEIVKPITKYATMIRDKTKIRYELEKLWHEMTSGRQAPVWLDIPLDIQGAEIDPAALFGFAAPDERKCTDVSAIVNALAKAKRPAILVGNGLVKCKAAFVSLADKLQIPLIPTWKAMDYVPNDHPLYAGRAGGMGDRPGNFTMQKADLLLCLGSRLDFSITGYDRSAWAENAVKFVVDIDSAEIAKLETALNIVPILADTGDVVAKLLAEELSLPDISEWKSHIAAWKTKYPITAPNDELSTYAFVQTLSKQLPEGAFVAPCSAGTTAEIFFQAYIAKKNQKVRSNHGLGSMGFDIPNAIGMCIASGGQDVICIAGDGGMQLNIQELSVIAGRKLPIKIFVVNNNGYASIRNMQKQHFAGRRFGCDESSGLHLPDLQKLSAAYGMPYICIDALDELEAGIERALAADGSVLCEVMVKGNCLVTPRTVTQVMPDGSMRSSRLEDQYPFLCETEAGGFE